MSTNPRMAYAVRGFTMVELVTSIVVIGILAAAIGPKFFENQKFVERGYTDEVAAALRYAQAVAIANGCGVRVTMTTNSYQAMQPSNGQPACNGGWNLAVTNVDGTQLTGAAPTGVTLKPATQITFNAQGRIANQAAVTLSNASFTLTVQPISGFVVVQ